MPVIIAASIARKIPGRMVQEEQKTRWRVRADRGPESEETPIGFPDQIRRKTKLEGTDIGLNTHRMSSTML
jgi:hypothetical protein